MDRVQAYFAQWTEKTQLSSCTSGGIASALAERVIRDGGVVAGAAYDANLAVRHIVVSDREALTRIRGVKYVRSEILRDVFDGIAGALRDGRPAMFVGLPCQVAAMRRRFGDVGGLLLVELVCFGAPDKRLWSKYVAWLETKRGKKLKGIDPRDKLHGWGHRTYWRYDWCDGTSDRRLSVYDPYAQAFYSAIAFGVGCYRCPFKLAASRADLTVGDAWGLEELGAPPWSLADGVSCVIVHTEAGRRAFSGIDACRQPVDLVSLRNHNRYMFVTAERPPRAGAFAKDLEQLDFGTLARRYRLQRTWVKTWANFALAVVKRAVKGVLS